MQPIHPSPSQSGITSPLAAVQADLDRAETQRIRQAAERAARMRLAQPSQSNLNFKNAVLIPAVGYAALGVPGLLIAGAVGIYRATR